MAVKGNGFARTADNSMLNSMDIGAVTRTCPPIASAMFDVLTIAITFGVSFQFVIHDVPRSFHGRTAWAAQAPLIVALFTALAVGTIVILALRGQYSGFVPSLIVMHQLCTVGCSAFCITCPVLLWTQAPFSWHLLPAVWLMLPFIILGQRRMLGRVLRQFGFERMRVLIVGNHDSLGTLESAIRTDQLGAGSTVACLDLTSLGLRAGDSVSVVRAALREGMRSIGANFLIVSLHNTSEQFRGTVLQVLGCETIPYAIVPDIGNLPVHGCSTYYYMSHSCLILSFRNDIQDPLARCLKAFFDRAVALGLLLVCLPAFLLVALAIKADGGPALYRHTRIGQHGRRFRCLKFCSMAVDSDRLLADLLATNAEAAAEWSHTRKLRNDPRVTRIGRFIRRTSLDELPQLINVLRGEMSLVGPRPVVEAEISRYGKEQDLYLRVKPGITGLWQVSGRSETNYAQRVALDAWYARNWSLWHDLTILFRTVPTLLSRRGAV